MNRQLLITAVVTIFSLLVFTDAKCQNDYLSKNQMIEDMEYLKNKLVASHPNLYTYCTPEELDTYFTSTKKQLPDSIKTSHAYAVISSVSGVLKDGHSYIYPSAAHLSEFYSSAPLFPFDVFLSMGDLFIIADNSEEQAIALGSKLIRINGILVRDIQSNIVQNVARDGDNLAYAKHLFYKFFPAYYSFFYGYCDTFNIEYENGNGEVSSQSISGLRRSVLKENRENKSKGSSDYARSEKGISLRQYNEDQFAVLTIKSFDKSILKDDYGQVFKKAVGAAFKEIRNSGVQHLAIDLRDNQGGALSSGIFLLQQFMQTPFQCVKRYQIVSSDKKTGARRLKEVSNKWDNVDDPVTNGYDGEMYLFINGGSYSCSAIVANAFKNGKRGMVIGGMTGGSAQVNSGAPNKVITLPNSKVLFTIPGTRYILDERLSNMKEGVVPDRIIKEDPKLIIDRRDAYLEALQSIIGE